MSHSPEARMDVCKQQFKLHKFGLHYFREEVFYLSQWNWPPVVYVIYRLVLAGYVLGWLIYEMIGVEMPGGHEGPYPWPVWLTNWTYLLLAIHLTLAALITILHSVKRWRACCHKIEDDIEFLYYEENQEQSTQSLVRRESYEERDPEVNIVTPGSIPWYMKLSWILHSMVNCNALLVTIMYWAALYPSIGHTNIVDVNLHGVNSVIVMLDTAITAHPVRLLHVIYPVIYGLAYVIFSIIYWSVDHTHVMYPGVLDWNNAGKTTGIVLAIGFALLPLLQSMHFGIHRFKLWLHGKIHGSS